MQRNNGAFLNIKWYFCTTRSAFLRPGTAVNKISMHRKKLN